MPLLEEYDYGEYMEIEDFKDSVRRGFFIDYDGYGLGVEGRIVYEDVIIFPSKIDEIPSSIEGIIWFNR